jgi:hypothetical protein
MGAITTTTYAEPLGYPNQQYIDRENYDGDLWFAKRVSATQVDIFKSSSNGATWSGPIATFTRTDLQEISGLFMDSNGHIHMCYRVYESGTDRIYYRRLAAGATTFDSEKFVVGASTGSAGGVYTGMDLVAFKLGTTWYIHMAVGTRNGANGGVTIFSATLSSTGTYTNRNTLVSGTRQWLNGPDGIVHPTILFQHTGDAKTTNGSPSLYIVWGRSTIYTALFTWASGPVWNSPNWNVPSSVSSLSPNQPSNSATFDAHGNRWLAIWPVGSGGSAVVRIGERSIDNTTQVQRDTPVHPQGAVRHAAISVSSATSNIRIVAVGTSTNKLYYIDYNRDADTWGTWTLVSAADIIGTDNRCYSLRRVNFGNGHFDLAIATGSSPFNLTSTSDTAASSPKQPTLSAPSNGVAQDVNAALTFSWNFVDDDPSDFQDSYALRRTIGASTTYWNNAGSSWDASEVFNASGTTSKTFPSGWGFDSDASHFYAVRVKDQQGNSSPYSSNVRVIPSAKDNPNITSPTASPTTATITPTWTLLRPQTAYRVILSVTATGEIVRDTGWVTSATQSVALPDQLQAIGYTLSVQARNEEGLTSNANSLNFTPAYTVPQKATLGLAANHTAGTVTVSVSNPSPTGSESNNATNTIYRRPVGSTNAVKIGVVGTSSPSSLLINYHPGFEAVNSNANWGTANGGVSSAARDTTDFHSGVASFVQTAVSGAGFAGINFGPLNTFAAVPGDQFYLEFWFKATAGRNIRGAVGWRTAANGPNNVPSQGAVVVATGSWQLYSMTSGAAPANTAFAYPTLVTCADTISVGEKAWADDVIFYEIGSSGGAPATRDDFTPASGINYEYSVITAAVNGAVRQSDWYS